MTARLLYVLATQNLMLCTRSHISSSSISTSQALDPGNLCSWSYETFKPQLFYLRHKLNRIYSKFPPQVLNTPAGVWDGSEPSIARGQGSAPSSRSWTFNQRCIDLQGLKHMLSSIDASGAHAYLPAWACALQCSMQTNHLFLPPCD